MRIAIVAPSPYEFVMGGAEHFWLGLQRFINEETTHHCELIKLSTREHSATELINAYMAHSSLDVRGFDRVLTGKYPSWMLFHPNHSIYMLHTLRGLYDTYHFMREPFEVNWSECPKWLPIALDDLPNLSADSNAPVMNLLSRISDAIVSGELSSHFVRHPGPFMRRLIHEMDRFAMQPSRIRNYATMSRTVANREGYFPAGVDVKIIPPPTRLTGFWCGGSDYIFTVSRLDGPKRVGLLIEAMKYSKTGVPLWIGGTGPEEQRLKELAAGDPRIIFMGSLTDAQLREAYANCLAVAFVPYDEDYGLVTLEAMRSRKPVLTTKDSGGVTEFVTHGETGYCVDPHPEALGSAIDNLFINKNKTRQMGITAERSIESISWRPLVEFALGEKLSRGIELDSQLPISPTKKRKKMVVAVTFPITPPRGGGQSRIYHLYKAIAKQFDVSIVCLSGAEDTASRNEIAPGLWEIRIPKSQKHQRRENMASSEVNWIPVTDIVAAREMRYTPDFLRALQQEGASADVVIASHPFLASVLVSLFPHIPLWLEAQDVELSLKKAILPDCAASNALLSLVENEERLAWERAECIFACSDQDLQTLERLYGSSAADKFVVPNGFSEEEVSFVTIEQRRTIRDRLGLDGRPFAIFLGSWHGPNLEACELIISAAIALPEVIFAIIGSAGEFFRDKPHPPNLKLLGAVDEEEKRVLLSAADVALNPMRTGTGSNLKMLDYFAAGVPVISTEFGARGIEAVADCHYIQTSLDGLVSTLTLFLLGNFDSQAITLRANELALRGYSWNVIGAKALLRFSAKLELN